MGLDEEFNVIQKLCSIQTQTLGVDATPVPIMN